MLFCAVHVLFLSSEGKPTALCAWTFPLRAHVALVKRRWDLGVSVVLLKNNTTSLMEVNVCR